MLGWAKKENPAYFVGRVFPQEHRIICG